MQPEDFPVLPPDVYVFSSEELDEPPRVNYNEFGLEEMRENNRRLARVGFSGTSSVEYVITPEGKPKNIVVTESSGDEQVDLVIMENVYNMRFTPGMLNGVAVYAQSGMDIEVGPGNDILEEMGL